MHSISQNPFYDIIIFRSHKFAIRRFIETLKYNKKDGVGI